MRAVLVFGGSGALGGAVCGKLASEGARVAFTYHANESAAMALADQLDGAPALPLDLASVSDIERVVREAESTLGRIDGFVQCAGVAMSVECAGETSSHRIHNIDEAAWDRMIDVNSKATFFAIRAVVDVMKRQGDGGGSIVVLGSIDTVKPVPAPAHVAASKGALAGMIAPLSKELGEHGILVNMVSPGLLEGGQSSAIPPNLLDEYEKHCGLKRRGTFDEIAAAIAWLVTRNTYMTGQTMLIDGAV